MGVGILILLSLYAAMPASDSISIWSGDESINEIDEDFQQNARAILSRTPTDKVNVDISYGLLPNMSFHMLNTVCEDMVNSKLPKPTIEMEMTMESIRLQLHMPCETSSYPLSEVDELLNDPNFDADKKIVIFAAGWNTTVDGYSHEQMAKAYNCRGDTNYLSLDTDDFINTIYILSTLNTINVGVLLAQALTSLVSEATEEKLHLMGFGLGAQIMGVAGREYHRLTGRLVPRVTGFNPPLACFINDKPLATLSAGDAKLVDIIDTAMGPVSESRLKGHVNINVGSRTADKRKRGHGTLAHERTWMYFAESVYPGNERNFLIRQCRSVKDLLKGRCMGEEYPMGYAMPHDLNGRFATRANFVQPFGQNATESFQHFGSKCGACVLT